MPLVNCEGIRIVRVCELEFFIKVKLWRSDPGDKTAPRPVSMSADLKIDTPAESIEALTKEAEALKTKLEEERQKLNDVARRLTFFL